MIAHYVTACMFYKLLQCSYNQYKDDNSSVSNTEQFENWRTEKENSHAQLRFWSQVLTIEILVLVFIRSIRETNFNLYRKSMSELVPYFFVLDNTNYACLLSVYLRDMAMTETRYSVMAQEFKNGHF